MKANRIIISDTDALATYIWHRRYLGEDSKEVEAIADSHDYSLYLLTEPDFGFIQDGTRESENLRSTMHGWFIDVLKEKNKPYHIIGGSHESRMLKAVKLIDSLLLNPLM